MNNEHNHDHEAIKLTLVISAIIGLSWIGLTV